MSRIEAALGRWRLTPTPIVAAGVIVATVLSLLAATRFGIPLWALPAALVPIGYVLWVMQRPMSGLFVVICVFFLPIQFGGVTLLQSVGVLTAGIVILWFLIERRTIYLGRIFLPLLLLGMLILISFFYTRDVVRTAFFFRKWLFNLFFFLLLTNLVTRFDTLKKVVWAVILMAAVNSAVGIFEFVTSAEAQFRSEGMLENANEFGNLAALAFPLALFQYMYQRGALRWLGLALCGLLFSGVVVSVSRGAFIALVVVFVTIVVTERRRILPLVLVAALAFLALPFLPDYFVNRVDNLVEDVENTVLVSQEGEKLTTRGYFNKGGLKIWLAHPFLGVGIGNFGFYFVEKQFNPGFRTSNLVPAHNIYLQALAEMGVVGLAVLLWLIGATFLNVLNARRASQSDHDRWLYFGAIEMMALTVFIASFSSGNVVAEDFWLLLGLTAVSGQVATKRVTPEERVTGLPEVASA